MAKLCMTLVTPWTVACQTPLSMGFSGTNTGVSCHFLLQGIFLTQGLYLTQGLSPVSPALAGKFFTSESQGSQLCQLHLNKKIKIKEGPSFIHKPQRREKSKE